MAPAPVTGGGSKMKSLLPVILGIVAIVFVVVTLGTTAWYNVNSSFSYSGGSYSYSSSLGLFSECATSNGVSACAGYTNLNGSAGSLILGTIAVTILGLVFVILGIVFTFIGSKRQAAGKMMSMLPFIFFLVGGIMILLGPFLFMGAVDNVFNGQSGFSFFGSSTSASGASVSNGPGIDWYLPFGSFALCLVAALMLFMARKKAASATPAVTPDYTQTQAGYGQSPAYPAAQPAYPSAQPAYGQPPMAPTPAYTPSPQPTYASPAPMAPAAQPGAAPVCRTCGQPTTYIAQYSRYYCQNCRQYV